MSELLRGQIRSIPVVSLLELALKKFLKGTIIFSSTSVTEKIFFKNGRITGSFSTDPSFYLGSYLSHCGYINPADIDKAYKTEQETSVKLGKVLDITGVTPEANIKSAVFEKVLDSLFLISRWNSGDYQITDKYDDDSSEIKNAISLPILKTGMESRRIEFEEALKMFEEIGDYPEVSTHFDKSKSCRFEKRLAELFILGKSVREISSGQKHFYFILKALLNLYKTGVISKGSGDPLSESEIVFSLEKYQDPTDIYIPENKALLAKSAETYISEGKFAKAAESLRILYGSEPENLLLKEDFTKVEHSALIYFYKNVFSRFALIKKTDKKFTVNHKNISHVYEHIQLLMPVWEIVASLRKSLHETEILDALEELKIAGFIREKKPANLGEACISGNLKTIEDVAKLGVDINQFMPAGESIYDNMTPLMIAVLRRNKSLIKLLVSLGANIEAKTPEGKTALYLATESGSLEFVRFLVECKADIHTKNNNDYTLLMLAAAKDYEEIIEYLIKTGADPNLRNKSGQTAVVSALRFNNLNALRVLIMGRAGLMNVDADGNNAAFYAQSDEAKEILEYGADLYTQIVYEIQKKDEEESAAQQQKTHRISKEIKEINVRKIALNAIFLLFLGLLGFIYLASSDSDEKNIKTTNAFENQPVNENHSAENQQTSKIEIAEKNSTRESINTSSPDCVIKESVPTPVLDERSMTKLMIASAKNNKLEVEGLISSGVQVNESINGYSALLIALQRGYGEIVQLLLENGAEPDTPSSFNGRTPLFYALNHSNFQLATMLVERGADINRKDFFCRSPLIDAIDENNMEKTEFLLKNGASPDTLLPDGDPVIFFAAEKNQRKVVEMLADYGADLSRRDPSGNSILGAVLEKKNWATAEILIAKGSDINARSLSGATLLMYYVYNNNLPAVKFLLDKGADPNLETDGKTAVTIAKTRKLHEIEEMLTSHGK